MNYDFYQKFEDEYRGSRQAIKNHLSIYIPYLMPILLQGESNSIVVDLGCGRGEWLEILKNLDFPAYGVELNEAQVNFCRNLNLRVEHTDALSWICGLPNESVSIISAFHLVEHMEFEDLTVLIREAHRVLKPGGLIILETPNPENLFVGACTFYLDPTHLKPIPQELLVFITSYYGFENSKVLRLSGSMASELIEVSGLTDVIFKVGLDYAVISQKGGNKQLLERMIPLLEKEGATGLHTAARQYDDIQNERERNFLELISNIRNDLDDIRLQQQSLMLLLNKRDDNFLTKIFNTITNKLKNIMENFRF